MKKTFTSIQSASRVYRSFRSSARVLICRAETPLLAAVILYKCAARIFFVPLMQQLWSLTLRFAPIHYLSNSNASDIFSSPAIIACIALIAVLTAFWALYEFSILLHGLDTARRGGKIRFIPLLRDSLRDIRHVLLPQNWLILIYSAVLIPFTNFFLVSNYVTQLAVPEYIMGVIRANARHHILSLLICVLLSVLCVLWAAVLPLFCLERKSLWQSVKESIRCLRRRMICTALLLLRWNLSTTLRALCLAAVIALPLYGIILCVGLQSTQAMIALSRAALLVEMPFLQFLFDCVIALAQCTLLALIYDRLREHASLTPEPSADCSRGRSGGRRIVAFAALGAAALTLLLSAVYVALPEDDEIRTLLGGTMPIITSHRGYSSAAPENTLPAFQLAIDHGSDRAELDVQMTKDGVVMVTHDTSLRRCTGRSANIYDLTYDEVRKLDAGRWFDARFSKTQIPTLEEVLDLCRVKKLDPGIVTGYILALGAGSYYDLPAADFFSVEATFITSGMVQQIHKRDKTISAWTVNREEDASRMLSLGVDDIITDQPEMVQQLLQKDAGPNDRLIRIRDALHDLFWPGEEADDSTDEVIEEAIESPDELLDAA